MAGNTGDQVWMIVDPTTKEAYREGDEPLTSAPLFFSTRERAEEYAREEELEEFEFYAVPAGVLTRMKGKPHWLDGKKMGK